MKSKHSQGTTVDPVRAVMRRVVSWRQFKRYRRRALQLKQVQPSVFRSPRVVTAIVYALQLMFDLASDSLKSFLAQKFLRRNYVDADLNTTCIEWLPIRGIHMTKRCAGLSFLMCCVSGSYRYLDRACHCPYRCCCRSANSPVWFEVPWISA